tara:strand:+ start:2695 stop:2841 length:147 start_codon:yes stop_codon:yes gene_type:complete
MRLLEYECDECDSKFTIEYGIRGTDSEPTYCPFCSSYLQYEEGDIEEE